MNTAVKRCSYNDSTCWDTKNRTADQQVNHTDVDRAISRSQITIHVHVYLSSLYQPQFKHAISIRHATQGITQGNLAPKTSSPDKRQLCHPADDAGHLFAAEQKSTKQDGQQHRQTAQEVGHSCGRRCCPNGHVHGRPNLQPYSFGYGCPSDNQQTSNFATTGHRCT